MHIYFVACISRAAEKAMEVFQKMRSGDKFEAKQRKRKKMKNEMSRLFNFKKAKSAAWHHKFVCLAYVDQSKIPSTDYDKDELYQAGLGEKEITFEDINITLSQFKDIIFESFPKLEAGGGFRFLKG